MLQMVPLALTVNALAALIGYWAATVSGSGAVCGALIGILIVVTTGWSGWALLVATFASAVITSRIGLRRKSLLGIAQEHGGRRGAGNAVANTGVAAIAALFGASTEWRDVALVAFVAALAAGGSDTVASEIGKARGGRTWLVTTGRAVPPGTPGAISLEGSFAGFLGALALGILAITLGIVPFGTLIPIIAGVVAGSLAESLLAATFEPRGIITNDALNFLNTAIAAVVASLLVYNAALQTG
jgi:uncharacterized protein (TIGR00297 family)